MDAVASGRRIRGDGETTEAEWAGWLTAWRPPSVTLDELLPAGGRLVVVSPHPDDEVLACGGLVALHARRAGEVAIVAVTDGEASHRGDAAWPADRLARERRVEREAGLARLGVAADAVTRLALPDGEVCSQIAALTCALLQTLRPTDCVVGTWRLDGHPDHDAVGAATAAVCAELGCRLLEAPVWMWHWSAPGDARVPWQRLRALALPEEASTRKADALAEHRTQLAARVDAPPVLGPAILARAARDAEYFFV
jgi:LmbE family N-acetylglucosaminyl deacetylase